MSGIKDNIGLVGVVDWVISHPDGSVEEGSTHNKVVNNGKAQDVLLLGGLGGTAFTALGIGSDTTTAPAITQTALVSELTTTASGVHRSAAAVSAQTTTVTGDTLKLSNTWSIAANAIVVGEVGIFNSAASAGSMLGRAQIGPVTLNSGDSLTVNYSVVFSSS